MVSLFSTKLEKLFDLRPSPAGFIFCSGGLSGLPCFRERRPESFSEEAGLFRGRFGMASAAVSGVVCASRVGHGVRAIRPGLFRNGPAKSCPGPLDPYPCRRACASAQPPASAHCPLLLFPSVSAFGVPRGRPSRCFAFPAAIPFLRRSLFSFVCASLQ